MTGTLFPLCLLSHASAQCKVPAGHQSGHCWQAVNQYCHTSMSHLLLMMLGRHYTA